MSTRTSVICDECSRARTEENHWFSALPIEGGKRPTLMTFDEAEFEYPNYKNRFDLCGRECAQSMLERWLDTGSILKTETGDTR